MTPPTNTREASKRLVIAARTLRTIIAERATPIESGADLATVAQAVALVCNALDAHDALAVSAARRRSARRLERARRDACAGELMAYGVSPEEAGQ